MGRKCAQCERLLALVETLTLAVAQKAPVVHDVKVKPAPVLAEEKALASHRDLYVERAIPAIQKELGCTATEARAEAELLADTLYAESFG